MALDGDIDAAPIGQAETPAVAGSVMKPHVPAPADVVADDAVQGVNGHPQRCTGDAAPQLQIKPESLKPHGKGKGVAYFPGHAGAEGETLDIGVGAVEAAEPVFVEIGTEAEAGEETDTVPEAVVHLTGVVKVGRNPGVLLGPLGKAVAKAKNLRLGHDEGHACGEVDSLELGDSRRVVGQGGRIVSPRQRGSGQGVAPGAVLGKSETGRKKGAGKDEKESSTGEQSVAEGLQGKTSSAVVRWGALIKGPPLYPCGPSHRR